MLAAVGYLLKFDPELLERRMKFKEKEREQQTIVLLGTAIFIAGFLAIVIDLRLHGLNQVSPYMALAAEGLGWLPRILPRKALPAGSSNMVVMTG